MPKLTKKTVFLFDVDMTLTNENREISDRTQKILALLQQKGYVAAVCTGRSWASLQQHNIPDLFAKDTIHITNVGAQLVRSGIVVWEKNINREAVAQLVALAQTQKLYLLAKNERQMFCSDVSWPKYQQFNENNPDLFVPIVQGQELPPIAAISLKLQTQRQENFLMSLQGLNVIKMTNYETDPFFEITATGVDKSTGVAQWCELTQTSFQDIIAFGDSANDLEFLKLVGYSVALGNAVDEVKQQADQVIGHTDEDGLAKYLEEVLETGEL